MSTRRVVSVMFRDQSRSRCSSTLVPKTPMLLGMLAAGTLDPRPLVTHRFRLDDIMRAYDTFANAATEKALKVVLTGG